MNALQDLLDFWKDFGVNNTDLIHNSDLKSVESIVAPEKSLAEFNKANDFRTEKIHNVYSNLVPVPFTGDITKGKIFFLLKNPGFSERDYNDEQNEDFTTELKNQLIQKFENDYAFTWINSKFDMTGGYNYWNGKMKFLVKRVQKDGNLSYEEAERLVASNIVDLELFPYHSYDSNKLTRDVLENTESVTKIKNFVKDYLIPKAKKGEVLLYVVRAEKDWDIQDEIDNKTVFLGKNKQKFGIGSREDFLSAASALILNTNK